MSFDWSTVRDRSQVLNNPAAALVNWDITVPQNLAYRIIGFTGLFTTDATVANRQILFFHRSRAGIDKAISGIARAHAASTAYYYSAAIGRTSADLNAWGTILIELPEITLYEGETFRIQSINSVNADQWTISNLTWKEAQMKDVVK